MITFLRRPAVNDAVKLVSVPVLAAAFLPTKLGPSGIDPWLYYGYATNFTDLLERYGWTYYAARLPWIFIVKLFFIVFSSTAAPLVLGVTISSIGSISLYCILRCYYSRAAAFLSAFALAANYWYIDDTFWLYVDGPAIAISLFALASFIHAFRGGAMAWFCASGLALTIGMNIHPVVLLMVLPSLCLIIIAEPKGQKQRLCWGIGWFSIAAASTMLTLCIVAWLEFDNFWFFIVTVSSLEWVVSGGWHNWVLPFSKWIRGATALLTPVGVLFAGTVVFTRDAVRWGLGPDAWIFGISAFFALCVLVSDGLVNAGRLQHSYYFIYLWMPTFLLLGSVMDRLTVGIGAFTRVAVGGAYVVGMGMLALGAEFRRAYMAGSMHAVAAAKVAIAVLLLGFVVSIWLQPRGNKVIQVLGIVMGVAFISLSSVADDRMAKWQSIRSMTDYQSTVAAQKFVNNNTSRDRKLLFWYNAKSPRQWEFTSINSVFLYEYSILNRSLPNLSDSDLQKFNAPASVILLSAGDAEAKEALNVLRERGLVERVVATANVGRRGKQVAVWILDTRSATDASVEIGANHGSAYEGQIGVPLPIDWAHVSPQNSSSFVPGDHWPITIDTPPHSWAYGAVLPYIIGSTRLDTPFRVRVRAKVLAGKVGIGLLKNGGDDFIQREFLSASPHTVSVTLTAANWRDAGPVVIQTAETAGSAKIIVDSIESVVDLTPLPIAIDWPQVERPSMAVSGLPMIVQTPSEPRAYGALIPYHLVQPAHGKPFWLRVRVRVLEGEAAFSLSSNSDRRADPPIVMAASDENQIIMLRADNEGEPLRLAVQNGDTTGRSTVLIESMTAGELP